MAERVLPAQVTVRLEPLLARVDGLFDPSNDEVVAQRKALYTFAVRVMGAAIAYIFQICLARWLGTYEFGIFVVVWTWITLLSSLVALGMDSAVIRLIPEYDATKDRASLRGILYASRWFAMASATVLVALAVLGIWLLGDLVTSYYAIPFYLGFACLPLLALASVHEGIARAYDWFDIALIPTYIFRPVLILLVVVGVGLTVEDRTAEWAMTAAIVGTWIVSIGQMLLINHRIAKDLEPGPRTYSFGKWLKISLPIVFIDGFFVFLTSTDVLVASQFVEPSEVAVYHAAIKTLAIAHFVYFAIRAVSAHRFSRLYHSGDHAGLAAYSAKTVRWCFWPTLLLCALMLLTGEFLLMLFGSEFTAGYPLLFILVIGILARSSIGPAESLLTMSGHQNACAVIYGTTFFLNLGLNYLLIWQFGLVGAAIATSTSLIFETALIYFVIRRRLGVSSFILVPPPDKAGP